MCAVIRAERLVSFAQENNGRRNQRMLTGKCINPQLMEALSLLGHGDKLLIADGNYPLASKTGDARKIWLGLCPGTPKVTEVLETLQSVINIESAEVMEPGEGEPEPEIFAEFTKMLDGMELKRMGRYEFYNACGEKTVCLAISTGEQRTFANILVTVGVA